MSDVGEKEMQVQEEEGISSKVVAWASLLLLPTTTRAVRKRKEV